MWKEAPSNRKLKILCSCSYHNHNHYQHYSRRFHCCVTDSSPSGNTLNRIIYLLYNYYCINIFIVMFILRYNAGYLLHARENNVVPKKHYKYSLPEISSDASFSFA
jgi:hypothetical protein